MSIVRSLQTTVTKIRALRERGNGDLENCLDVILEDIEADIERVRGLEDASHIDTDLLKAFQNQEAIYGNG